MPLKLIAEGRPLLHPHGGGADEDLAFSLNTAASGQPGAIIGTNVVTTAGATSASRPSGTSRAACTTESNGSSGTGSRATNLGTVDQGCKS